MYFLLRRENKRRDLGERDEVIITNGSSEGGDPKNGIYVSTEEARREKERNRTRKKHQNKNQHRNQTIESASPFAVMLRCIEADEGV